jgi:hypothetical protein
MAKIENSFQYDTFNGILCDTWRVYRGIVFENVKYDEAHVHVNTGEIEFYDDDAPDAKAFSLTGIYK